MRRQTHYEFVRNACFRASGGITSHPFIDNKVFFILAMWQRFRPATVSDYESIKKHCARRKLAQLNIETTHKPGGFMSIRTTTPDPVKVLLRKKRDVPGKVKAIIYQGNKAGPNLAMQFHQDVMTYGLWEALLYVEGYEGHGEYAPGTAQKAIDAATPKRFKVQPDQRMQWDHQVPLTVP